ncbi:MAG: NUDIX hydrolase [Planctomycetota bacterium]
MSEHTSDHSAPGRIRPLALCVLSRNGCYLLADGYDSVKDETFYRPPGGGIEFGETSAEAVRREIREEMDIEIENVRKLGVLENIFTFDGQPMHEIVFILDADPVDPCVYDREQLTGRDSDGRQFTCHWVDIHTVDPEFPPIYPDGLADILD